METPIDAAIANLRHKCSMALHRGTHTLGLLLDAALMAVRQGQEADQTIWAGEEGRTLEHESVGEQLNERTGFNTWKKRVFPL